MPTLKRVYQPVRAKRRYPTPVLKPARLTGLVAKIRAHQGRKPKSR